MVPSFFKFCTYFPYNAKLCLNSHEYVKRQPTNRGISYQALDNGILSFDDPKRVQALCDGLLRKWFRKLPVHSQPKIGKPVTGIGSRLCKLSYHSLTHSLTHSLKCWTVRLPGGFFRRSDSRKPGHRTAEPGAVGGSTAVPGKFRTRVITDGVVPSPHVDYKNSRIKQYHKEGRALRTESTINNTRDFGIGKLLNNLPAG